MKQLVQMPFQFNLSHDATAGTPTRPDANTPRCVKAKTPPVSESAKGTYFEFQVTRQATPKADSPRPRYPDELRSANVEGEVLAQFVVDEDGHAIPETLKILKTSHDLFTESVRKALPTDAVRCRAVQWAQRQAASPDALHIQLVEMS